MSKEIRDVVYLSWPARNPAYVIIVRYDSGLVTVVINVMLFVLFFITGLLLLMSSVITIRGIYVTVGTCFH